MRFSHLFEKRFFVRGGGLMYQSVLKYSNIIVRPLEALGARSRASQPINIRRARLPHFNAPGFSG